MKKDEILQKLLDDLNRADVEETAWAFFGRKAWLALQKANEALRSENAPNKVLHPTPESGGTLPEMSTHEM